MAQPAKLEDARTAAHPQAQLWSEYADAASFSTCLCALAERAWGSPEQSWEEFEERLRGHLPRLDAFGIRYRPLD